MPLQLSHKTDESHFEDYSFQGPQPMQRSFAESSVGHNNFNRNIQVFQNRFQNLDLSQSAANSHINTLQSNMISNDDTHSNYNLTNIAQDNPYQQRPAQRHYTADQQRSYTDERQSMLPTHNTPTLYTGAKQHEQSLLPVITYKLHK